MIPGPFIPTEGERSWDLAFMRRLEAEYPERVSVVDGDREIHLWRRRPTSSLRAFWIWLLAAFVAGVVFTLLAQLALGALLSTASWSRSSVVDGSAARAAVLRGVTATHEVGGLEIAGPSPAASAARATLASAIDELPASARSVSPRATVAPLRDDPASSIAPRATPVPRAFVEAIAVRYGLDPAWLYGVLWCESRLYPDRIGAAGERGPAQFLPATWNANAPRLGFTPADIDDPAKNIELAALVMSEDGAGRWTCAHGD